MLLPTPLLVSATVSLALSPLRRIRLLMSVEDDLVEEGVVPSNTKGSVNGSKSGPGNRGGLGGAVGAAKFLYQVGGVQAFYRGAALEYAGVVMKYLIQVSVVVPICRRIPLRMHHSYTLATLLHTVVLFLPVAPVQLVIDAIVVNACTDFTRKQETPGNTKKTPEVTEVDGTRFRFRFRSLWEAARTAWRTLPILPLANKLMLLDFAGRYISSLVFNKVIGFFYEKLLSDGDNHAVLSALMRVVPPLASIGYGLLTYPLVSLPFAHFVRARTHEREAAAVAKAKEEEEREYRPQGHSGNKSFQGSRSMRLSGYPRPEEEESKLLADRVVELLCHWDVRDYLYFTYEQWGIRGLYRGYSMQVAAITLGVGCGALATQVLALLHSSLLRGGGGGGGVAAAVSS